MSSGQKRVVINQRERVVSTDHNRLQAFAAADLASVLRFLFDAQSLHDEESDGAETVGAATGSPLRGTIISGIRPRPVNGTTDLLIEPGVALLVNPDSPVDPDDNPFKFIVDPGVQSLGQLTLTPGGGATRIDVIECQRTDQVVETASRDIFDPATGTFTAANVTKVRAGALQYRIRTGSAGAGYPGPAAGWLPLAVAAVPAAAATWDTVVLYDVRPLAADRNNAPYDSARRLPQPERALLVKSHFGGHVLSGAAWSTAVVGGTLGGYRAGGMLHQDFAALDFNSVGNVIHEPGFTFGNTVTNIWALFPHGLPRWARYTPSSLGIRKPGPFRGILCVSQTGPTDMSGRPLNDVVPPAATGLLVGSATSNAVLLAASYNNHGWMADGEVCWLRVGPSPAPTLADNLAGEWTLTDGVHYPANARAIWVEFSAAVAPSGTVNLINTITVADVTSPGNSLLTIGGSRTSTAINSTVGEWMRIPLVPTYPRLLAGAPYSRLVRWSILAGSAVITAHAATVRGWELGP